MTYDEEHLMHYGVLGMKWGKRRARKQEDQIRKQVRKEVEKELRDEAKAVQRQRRMSNKELQARVKRLKLEDEYNKLKPKSDTKKKVETVVKTLGTVAAITGTAYKIYENMDKISKVAKEAKKAIK